ncbi:MAG: transcription antitermination factor NusB [Clostridiales bacterium]|nr:transcription antitermination factor NusB [Clostridiales bacterium]
MALHAARRVALQMVFANLFQSDGCESVLEGQEDLLNLGEDQVFIDEALQGTLKNQAKYNQIIQSLSPDRSLDRIPALNKAILYLSLHELSQPNSLPKVIINEAVELAKRFGDEGDSRFINGVLGSYLRMNQS